MAQLSCPRCRRRFRYAEASAGKRAKCPNCGEMIALPEPRQAVLPEAANPFDQVHRGKPGRVLRMLAPVLTVLLLIMLAIIQLNRGPATPTPSPVAAAPVETPEPTKISSNPEKTPGDQKDPPDFAPKPPVDPNPKLEPPELSKPPDPVVPPAPVDPRAEAIDRAIKIFNAAAEKAQGDQRLALRLNTAELSFLRGDPEPAAKALADAEKSAALAVEPAIARIRLLHRLGDATARDAALKQAIAAATSRPVAEALSDSRRLMEAVELIGVGAAKHAIAAAALQVVDAQPAPQPPRINTLPYEHAMTARFANFDQAILLIAAAGDDDLFTTALNRMGSREAARVDDGSVQARQMAIALVHARQFDWARRYATAHAPQVMPLVAAAAVDAGEESVAQLFIDEKYLGKTPTLDHPVQAELVRAAVRDGNMDRALTLAAPLRNESRGIAYAYMTDALIAADRRAEWDEGISIVHMDDRVPALAALSAALSKRGDVKGSEAAIAERRKWQARMSFGETASAIRVMHRVGDTVGAKECTKDLMDRLREYARRNKPDANDVRLAVHVFAEVGDYETALAVPSAPQEFAHRTVIEAMVRAGRFDAALEAQLAKPDAPDLFPFILAAKARKDDAPAALRFAVDVLEKRGMSAAGSVMAALP